MIVEGEAKSLLYEKEISPKESLGQHFLVDVEKIGMIAKSVIPGSRVIEVGSGIGHVTKALAQ